MCKHLRLKGVVLYISLELVNLKLINKTMKKMIKEDMVSSKELRKGNYLLGSYHEEESEKLGLCKVNCIGHVDITEYSINVEGIEQQQEYYNYFQGELITEEWLLDFGFSKREIKITGGMEEYELDMLSFLFRDKKIVYVSVGVQRIDNGSEIKYIHQLQNLYFSLTGEELTLTKMY